HLLDLAQRRAVAGDDVHRRLDRAGVNLRAAARRLLALLIDRHRYRSLRHWDWFRCCVAIGVPACWLEHACRYTLAGTRSMYAIGRLQPSGGICAGSL